MYSVLNQHHIDNLNKWLAGSTLASAKASANCVAKESARELVEESDKGSSYIVVGAGAAGSVVAARLAENPNNRVLVIELGPNNLGNEYVDNPATASLMWDNPEGPRFSPSSLSFQTTTQLGRNYTYPRGNGAGGSSNHHSLVDGRGHPLIYDNIAKLLNDPLWSYRHVLPYFKKMEHYHGTSNDGSNETDSENDVSDSSNCHQQQTTYSSSRYHGYDGWLSVRQLQPKSDFDHQLLQACHEVTGAPIRDDMSGNPCQVDGVGFVEFQVKPDGKRCYAFGDLLVPTMKRNKNIVVLFNTLATKVLLEKDTVFPNDNYDCHRESRTSLTSARGVEILHKPNAYGADKALDINNCNTSSKQVKGCLFCTGEVILSGGAINTPQLLLLSGIGPAEQLQQFDIDVIVDSPQVGNNLLDHHEINVVHELDPNKILWSGQAQKLSQQTNNPQLLAYLQQFIDDHHVHDDSNNCGCEHKHEHGKHDNDHGGGVAGGIVLDWYSGLPTDVGHDLHIDNGQGFFFDFDLSSVKPLPDGRVRTDFARDETNIQDVHVYYHTLLEVLRPSSATGSIKLASADPTVQPRLNLGLHEDDEACHRLALGIQMVRQIFQHPSIKQYYLREVFPSDAFQTVEELKYYTKRWSAFGHHIAGTAAMGCDINQGVIDSRLRVHGVSRLRVVDTSVYPAPYFHGYNVSRGAYLIGELAADFIKSDAQKRYCS